MRTCVNKDEELHIGSGRKRDPPGKHFMLPCFAVSNLIPRVSICIRSFKIPIGGRSEFSYNSGGFESVPEERFLLGIDHARSASKEDARARFIESTFRNDERCRRVY